MNRLQIVAIGSNSVFFPVIDASLIFAHTPIVVIIKIQTTDFIAVFHLMDILVHNELKPISQDDQVGVGYDIFILNTVFDRKSHSLYKPDIKSGHHHHDTADSLRKCHRFDLDPSKARFRPLIGFR